MNSRRSEADARGLVVGEYRPVYPGTPEAALARTMLRLVREGVASVDRAGRVTVPEAVAPEARRPRRRSAA